MEAKNKYCNSCKEWKLLSDFSKDKAKKDGLRSNCRACRNEQTRRWKANNPEKEKEFQKRSKQAIRKDPIRHARSKIWQQNTYTRNYRRKLYNITHEQFLAMVEGQNNKCAMCGNPETSMSNNGSVRALAVDHDHITNEIRGLLCFKCNANLGILESRDLLSIAIPYLIECNSNPETVSILQSIQQYLESKQPVKPDFR